MHVRHDARDLVRYTNVSDEDATILHLARRGYGSVAEIEQWDTPQLLDAVEFEQIQNDIERYYTQNPKGP